MPESPQTPEPSTQNENPLSSAAVENGNAVAAHLRSLAGEIAGRQAALNEAAAELRAVLEGAGMATWKWHPASDRVLFQRNVDTMYGLSESFETYAQLMPYIHPEDLPRNIAAIERSIANGEKLEIEYRVLRPDGETVWVSSIASLLHEGDEKVFVGIKMDITARKRAEENLRESEARYRALAEGGSKFVWINRADGYTIYVNPQWTQFTGLTLEQTVGSGWSDVLHPDDQQQVFESHRNALATGTAHETQLRYRRASDGAYRWFIIRSTPIRDENGVIQHWMGVAMDIHAQKEAEAALRESEERFRLAAEAMNGMIYEWHVPTGAVQHSKGLFNLIGLHPHQVPADLNWWRRRIHPDDYENIDRRYNAAAQVRSPLYNAEYRVRHEDGHYVWVWDSSSLVYDENGALLRMVGCIISIDERKKAEEAVRESEVRFRTMADTAPVLIWLSGLDQNYYYFNKPWLDFTGRSMEQETGNGWSAGVHPDDLARCRDTYVSHFHARREFKMEYRLRRHDGQYRWILDHGVPRFTPCGDFLGYIGSCIDIEERKQAEQENARLLREAQEANRLKDEFLAIVSHELRTPLNAILGWAHLGNSGAIGQDEIPHALEVIERNARAQAQIVEDILDVARVVSGKMRIEIAPVALDALAREVIESVRPSAEAKNIVLHTRFAPQLPALTGDPGRLRQIIWNLLSNAIKFTPKNGSVTVQISQSGSMMEMQVIDSGQGIEPDFQPYVFDRFRQADGGTTRRHGGLGLGLSLVRHLTEAHGGSVAAHSEGKDCGSVFTVRLPLQAAQSEAQSEMPPRNGTPKTASPAAPAPHANAFSGARFLVVDDSSDALQMLATLLHQAGASVEIVPGADAARAKISEQPFDLVLSDLGMPDEDGYALLRWLRDWSDTQKSPLPAVALTAYASSEERTRALEAGFAAFVPKPIETDELMATLTRVLGRRNGL